MKITVTPSDLISRFVWDKYVYYILKDLNKEQVNEIIQKNEAFEIDEKDAFVIGLLHCIFTDEVIYVYTQFLRHILDNKSFTPKNEKRSYITRQTLLMYADKFFNKVPNDFKLEGEPKWNIQYNQLTELHQLFTDSVNNLEMEIIQDWECVKSAQVKKIINKIQWI